MVFPGNAHFLVPSINVIYITLVHGSGKHSILRYFYLKAKVVICGLESSEHFCMENLCDCEISLKFRLVV